MMSASELSAAIRAKKKKISESIDIADTSPVPDMNAQDVWNAEKDGYVEDVLDSPKKINAEETMMSEPGEEALQKMREGRMARLRSYLNGMSLSDK